ncbi:hypothetical protein ACNPMO_14995, partial [Enterococcus faecium]
METDPPIIEDDPKTSPYPIWNSTTFYSAGVKVVWHGSVYVAKWWNQGGNAPDDPTLDTGAAAWSYIGPVLASDQPFRLPQLPANTFPEWDATTSASDEIDTLFSLCAASTGPPDDVEAAAAEHR